MTRLLSAYMLMSLSDLLSTSYPFEFVSWRNNERKNTLDYQYDKIHVHVASVSLMYVCVCIHVCVGVCMCVFMCVHVSMYV